MKNSKLHLKFENITTLFLLAGIIVLATMSKCVFADSTNITQILMSQELIASVKAKDFSDFNKIYQEFQYERGRLDVELMKIFLDSKTSNLSRCAAAFYIGELRVHDSSEALVSQIRLQFEPHEDFLSIPVLAGLPAVEALVKIGTPAIPSLIKGLENSDDEQNRALSLKVLFRIENDEEIVRLRLKKALAAQADLQKRSRLELALEMLSKNSPDK